MLLLTLTAVLAFDTRIITWFGAFFGDVSSCTFSQHFPRIALLVESILTLITVTTDDGRWIAWSFAFFGAVPFLSVKLISFTS